MSRASWRWVELVREIDKPAAKLSADAASVLLMLALHVGGADGKSHPGEATLAIKTGIPPRSIQRALVQLRTIAGLKVRRRWRSSNEYELDEAALSRLPRYFRQGGGTSDAEHAESSRQGGGNKDESSRHPGAISPAKTRVSSRHPGAREGSEKDQGEGSPSLRSGELFGEEPSLSKPKRANRNAKHTAEQIVAKDALIVVFVEAFTAAKGIAPSLSNAGDHAAAFTLTMRFGLEEASAIVRRALADPWVLEHNPTLRYIAGKPDAWRGKALATKASARNGTHQRDPEDGAAWESALGAKAAGT